MFCPFGVRSGAPSPRPGRLSSYPLTKEGRKGAIFHRYLIAFFARIDYNVFVIIKEKYYNRQIINIKVVK